MASITNYTTLISEVVDELDRDDIEDKLPRYIGEVEADLKRRLRTLDMEVIDDLTASSEDTALPADFLSLRTVYIDGTPDRPLAGMSPASIVEAYSGATGTPEAYAIIGTDLRLAPPPASSTALKIVYTAAFDGLSVSNATNWIITNHPDIYFNGVAAMACRYSRDDDGFTIYWTTYNAAVEQLKAARSKDRWGGPIVRSPNVRSVRNIRA